MSLYKNENIKSIEYLNTQYFKIKWRLTGWCNYSCWYCINGQNKEQNKEWNTTELLINRARKINKMLKDNNITKPIHLSLIGGEVTYLDLKSILNEINNLGHINITTNFSRPVEYFTDLFNWCKERNIKMFLHCSYHPESINFIPKFVELTDWCKTNHIGLPRASIVVGKDDNVEEKLKPFLDAGIEKIVAQKMKVIEDWHLPDLEISQQNKLTELNKKYEELKTGRKDYKITFNDNSDVYLKSISNLFSNLDYGGFKPFGFNCCAGFNGVVINWDGNVERTNCRYFEQPENILGNIDNDNIKLPTIPHLCQVTDYCCWLHNGTSVYRKE